MKGVQVDEKKLLGRSLKKMNIGFDTSQLEDIIRYKDFLMEANRSINLGEIIDL